MTMTDNELKVLLVATLEPLLVAQGFPLLRVTAEYQSTTQGRIPDPAIYYALGDATPVGAQGRSYKYDNVTDTGATIEHQWYRSTFTIAGLSEDDPTDLTRPTAADLTSLCLMLVKSQAFVTALATVQVGLETPAAIRNPKFLNDQGQFEDNPSFDFTVTHQRRIIQTTHGLKAIEANFLRV